MTHEQALTQRLGELLELRSLIHVGHVRCCASMAREIDHKIDKTRQEIRVLAGSAENKAQLELLGD
jgi:hypothetical protein